MNNRPLHPVGDVSALVSGALLTLAFAPFAVFPLAALLPALLLWLCEGASPRRAALRGALFGLGLYATGIYWIYISLHDYGHAPAAFAALATFIVVLLMLSYIAIFAYLLTRLAPRPGPVKWLIIAPALWTLLEWTRSWLFTGFPWLSLGYSQIDGPLAGLAPYLGVFGVGWAVLLSAGLLMLLTWRERLWRIAASTLFIALWAGAWGLGQTSWVDAAGEPVKTSLVQGNISQTDKFTEDGIVRALTLYTQLSWNDAAGSDLIIWPETAIPVFFSDLPPDFLENLTQQAHSSNTDILTGVPTGDWETRVFYNAVVSLGSQQGFYRKRRLLPFGEYVPLRFILNFFHRFVDIPMADFTPGKRDQPLLYARGHPVGVSICFEAAFGSEIRHALPQAQFLVNVSNDAWFGHSLAPYQHLQIARMRALEAGRYLARATNTGISALIDERGRIIERGQLFTTQVLQGWIQPLSGATPYALMGDKGIVLLTFVLLVSGVTLSRRQRDNTNERSDGYEQ